MREAEWRQWSGLGWWDGGGGTLLSLASFRVVFRQRRGSSVAALGWGLLVDVLEVVERPPVCRAGQTKAVKMTAYKFSIAQANNFSWLFSAVVGFSSGGIRLGGVEALQTLCW